MVAAAAAAPIRVSLLNSSAIRSVYSSGTRSCLLLLVVAVSIRPDNCFKLTVYWE